MNKNSLSLSNTTGKQTSVQTAPGSNYTCWPEVVTQEYAADIELITEKDADAVLKNVSFNINIMHKL